jgi:hypothetical protein
VSNIEFEGGEGTFLVKQAQPSHVFITTPVEPPKRTRASYRSWGYVGLSTSRDPSGQRNFKTASEVPVSQLRTHGGWVVGSGEEGRGRKRRRGETRQAVYL